MLGLERYFIILGLLDRPLQRQSEGVDPGVWGVLACPIAVAALADIPPSIPPTPSHDIERGWAIFPLFPLFPPY